MTHAAHRRSVLATAAACLTLALGLHAGCDDSSNSPQLNGKTNVCTDYSTCDECIAGQQERGHSKGEAETQCGAAVLGCFTTWEKPIRCGGKKMDEDGKAAADADDE